MKVVDASIIVELLTNDLDLDRLGDEELVAPHLIDSEVTNVLRRLVLHKNLTQEQGTLALEGFTCLVLTKYPEDWLRPRMWVLRNNLSAFEATYAALAEMLEATAPFAADARLADTQGIQCLVSKWSNYSYALGPFRECNRS